MADLKSEEDGDRETMTTSVETSTLTAASFEDLVREMIVRLGDHTCLCSSPSARASSRVAAMPLTGSGKIQKFKLREQWSKGEMKEL